MSTGGRSRSGDSLFARQPGLVLREPQFLHEARVRHAAADVVFQNVDGPWGGGVLAREPTPAPIVEAPAARPAPPVMGPPHPATHAAVAAAAYGHPLPTPPPPPPEPAPPPPPPVPVGPGPEEFAERIAASVAALRLTSERLAEAVRSDALELALLLSRRIVETEVASNVDALFSLVRSVVRKVGESRKVVVRVAPENAARISEAGASKVLSGLAAAEVEVVGDAALGVADCVVEADFGSVDGRADTRFDELRRIVREASAEERT